MAYLLALLCITLVVLLVAWTWTGSRSLQRSLPPGPPGIPFLGHVFSLPREKPWVQFGIWGKQYGDIVSLRVFNRSMVILNSLEVAIELEEKRAPLYSDRPRRVMAELSGYGAVTTFRVRYDDAVKTAKRYMHGGFNKSAVSQYETTQVHASRDLCRQLRESPEFWLEHLRESTISVMRTLIYGEGARVTSLAPQEELYRDVLSQFTKMASPSQYLVDTFPLLRYIPSWFPGASFQREAARNREQISRFIVSPYTEIKGRLVAGAMTPCFLANILSTQHLNREEEEALQYAAGSAFGAGYETTVAALAAFFMAMVLNPSTQRLAHLELDAVLARDSLPSFTDRASLPFVECIVSEVLRWRPPVPFAWRCVRAEDHYRGYTIPAGTLITVNVRGLTHDPGRYTDAGEFKPERFLDRNGQYSTSIAPDPRRFLFGFGRRCVEDVACSRPPHMTNTLPRSCPGAHVADNFLFIVIATILASFTISPALDPAGNPILPDSDYSSGLGGICQPPPFPCRITPRERESSSGGPKGSR